MKDSAQHDSDVLRGINLDISEGEVLGLLGPNGAGKTTLVEILATLLLPTCGTATVCGSDLVPRTLPPCANSSATARARPTIFIRVCRPSRTLEFFRRAERTSHREMRAPELSPCSKASWRLEGKGKEDAVSALIRMA